MKRTTKIVAVIALTVGVAGGAAAFGKHRMGDPSRKADFITSYISNELELDATQKQSLDVLKDQLLAARQTMKGDVTAMHAQAESLVTGEYFDKELAMQLVTDKTSAINAAAPEIVSALADFFDSLNVDQKSEITSLMKEHHEHRGGRH